MLTKRDVDHFCFDPSGPATQILYDEGGVPGFGVRVRESGRKSFVLWYRTKTGRPRMITLGTFGAMTLKQARDEAKDRLAEVRRGSDPLESRRKERSADTVASFADIYMEDHAKPRKRSWREDRRRLSRYIVPAIGKLKLTEVRRADVARLHKAIGRTKPYEANRVLALISVFFSKAAEWGYLPEGAPNPAKNVQRLEERSREQYVKPDQMPALAAAIDSETNPYVRAAFKLYLLTGLRRSELLSLRWSAVDLRAHRVRLEDTKAKRAHEVHLSEPAAMILMALPRQLGSPYVFPGRRPGKPLVNVTKPWHRIRARLWLSMNPKAAGDLRRRAEADLDARKRGPKRGTARREAVEARLLKLARRAMASDNPLRIHDLRRTTGSWLAIGGASLPLIGKVLNHSHAKTTQIYAKLSQDVTEAPMEAVGAEMTNAGLKVG